MPFGPMSRNSNVDDSSCLFYGSLTSFRLQNVSISRHFTYYNIKELLHGANAVNPAGIKSPPSATSHSGTSDSRPTVQ
jgi:hypothetical protein